MANLKAHEKERDKDGCSTVDPTWIHLEELPKSKFLQTVPKMVPAKDTAHGQGDETEGTMMVKPRDSHSDTRALSEAKTRRFHLLSLEDPKLLQPATIK
jgi:hypothetical protein